MLRLVRLQRHVPQVATSELGYCGTDAWARRFGPHVAYAGLHSSAPVRCILPGYVHISCSVWLSQDFEKADVRYDLRRPLLDAWLPCQKGKAGLARAYCISAVMCLTCYTCNCNTARPHPNSFRVDLQDHGQCCLGPPLF